MKVAINLIPFSSVSGIEIFAKNLLVQLIKIAKKQKGIKVVVLRGKDAPQFLFFPDTEVITVPAKGKIQKALYQQTKIYALLKKIKADVLFAPSPAAPFFYKNKIVVIHDCAYDRFKEFENILSKIYFRAMFYGAKYFSKKIITVSNFSKKELIELYKINPDKIEVIYEGVPEMAEVDEKEIEVTLNKFKINKSYFLYIGNWRPRKNLSGLIKAFKIFLKNTKQDLLLIIGGREDKRFLDLEKEIKKNQLDRKIILTDTLSRKEVTALYKKSKALIFPSFYEGFGLPVLEAQSLGIPVLTSNTSSLPEVGGDSVLYVDPYDIEEIAKGMERIAFDEKLRKDLVKKGFQNLKRFSWEKSAQRLLNLFQQVIGKDYL